MKGKLSFIKELAGGLLPSRSEQEIRDHEAWYQQYLQLNDRKKEVIQRWREKKEVVLDVLMLVIISSSSCSTLTAGSVTNIVIYSKRLYFCLGLVGWHGGAVVKALVL